MELKVEMSQTLALSQRMIQSTEILQMSSQELETYLKEMAIENPVIDIEEKYDEPDKTTDIQKKLEWLESSDEQNRVYYSGDYGQEDDDHQDMWNVSDHRGEGLEDYLLSQLIALSLSEKEEKLVRHVIGLLDDRGYFIDEEQEIASETDCSIEDIENALRIVQSFEPAGVGARNLSECLTLQMDRQHLNNPIVREIVSDHLELLGKNQLPAIAKKMKINVDQVLEALEVIKSFNPKPGNSFSSRENLKYVTPDVTVVKLKDYFEILLNEYMYPKIGINSYYRNMLKQSDSKETKDYVSQKVRQAEWVMQCLSQRSQTLMNVTKCIVDRQEVFFSNGPGYLHPLKLVDVADMLGMHESTISRAVKDKYLQCSWGIYPMNYFFTAAISRSTSQEGNSADRVKKMLKDIIDGEKKEKPYSDRILAELLEKDGVKISRRTVAKYRESLGIRDASGRKVF